MINPFFQRMELRYISVGFKELPRYDVLRPELDHLLGAMKRLCFENRGVEEVVETPDMTEVVEKIKAMWEMFVGCRSKFSAMPPEVIGAEVLETGAYYRVRGHNVEFHYPGGVTEDIRKREGVATQWLNESYIVRMISLLNYYRVLEPNIDTDLVGAEDVNLSRRLRGIFCHTSGRYDKDDREEKKLFTRLVAQYGLSGEDPTVKSEFPLPIDTILEVMTEGCVRYIEAVAEKKGKKDNLTRAERLMNV